MGEQRTDPRAGDTGIVVFTRDLRIIDNPALTAASKASDRVLPLFVVDDDIAVDAMPNRATYLADCLRDLDRSLRARGARLVVGRGRWHDEVLRIATSVAARSIHVSDDVSAFAIARLDRLERAAASVGITVHRHPGVTVVPPGTLRPSRGAGYAVFTPYHRRWLGASWRRVVGDVGPLTLPGATHTLAGVELLDDGFPPAGARGLLRGGETEARRRLGDWTNAHLERYTDQHDDLAAAATSRISADLHFGCLSATEVATRLRDRPGGAAFVRQLCWRDFFHQVLAARPDAATVDLRHRERTWNDDPDGFAAWTSGTTGFPLVDAGMRQLASEGFVHNRARMVVASFLTKELSIDWRLGAAHFMSLLVDGDVANNQLNWQWVAGTGTDTNAHRIFNPTRQSERFDPAGDYIRRHVPELGTLEARQIHDPPAARRQAVGYPPPIVDRAAAIAAYRASTSHAR